MLGDKTPSNIVWWPNMLMLKWVAKQLKHVWSNTCAWDNWYKPLSKCGIRMSASNMFDSGCSTNKTSPIKHDNKRIALSSQSNVWGPSNLWNTTNHDQTRSNTIKQHQTRCANGKMLGHQTMFDGVWSPNISRLSRALDAFSVDLNIIRNGFLQHPHRIIFASYLFHWRLELTFLPSGQHTIHCHILYNEYLQCLSPLLVTSKAHWKIKDSIARLIFLTHTYN